jgi:hypothetical protein
MLKGPLGLWRYELANAPRLHATTFFLKSAATGAGDR